MSAMPPSPPPAPPRADAVLQPLRGLGRRSLGLRIVLLFFGLLLAVQAVSFFAIHATIERNARASIAESLAAGEHVLRRLLDQNAHNLVQGASLLAAEPGFRAALASHDADRLATALAVHGDRIGATVTALLDTHFVLETAAQPGLEELQPAIDRLVQRSGRVRPAHGIVVLGRRPFQLVLVPVRTPTVAAWVVMGQPIGQPLLDDLRDLSTLHASVRVRDGAAGGWLGAVSTLSGAAATAANAPRRDDVLHLPDGQYSARAVRLADGGGGGGGGGVKRSLDAAVAPYRRLQIGLAALTLLGIGVFAVGSVLTARRITSPLRRLVAAAERVGAGDYTTPLAGRYRSDEIGELAQSFERMRGNIAGQRQEILQLAYWDQLTGLPNRVQFRDAVRTAVEAACAARRSVAVVMLDLDRFKHVNDVLGYRIGDLMLQGVANRLVQDAVRQGDLVARLDGDEFAVLLPDLDPAGDVDLARAVAQRIAQAMDRDLVLEDQSLDLSASIGLALWPRHAADGDTLLGRAEIAMYAAKRRREGPALYDNALDAAAGQSLSMLGELRRAVDRDELRLVLQPKLALDSARVVGAEALLRWEHPQRGLVMPMAFVPFAEQTGFIRVLTLWVFEQAAREWKRLQSVGMTLTLSVNLSTRDLLDPDLPAKFEERLVRHAVPAEAFCLEITESAIMDDPERALATLARLHALGFRLSIDDFGTGYSSLAYLKRLPVDELKIDRSFVLSMERDLDDARIVRSTIDLAHGLGMTVVAEGVENAQVWELLRALHCDEAQGFHMSRPLPPAEFERWAMLWTARHAQPLLPPGHSPDAAITLH